MSRPDRRGFTLLEAVVALTILGLAGVAALEALGAEVRGAERARTASTAAALAQDRVAAVALVPPRDLDALPDSFARGTFGPPFSDYHWTARVQPVLGEADLYEVRVEVSSDAAPYTLVTRVYRPRPPRPL
ncbi:MAG TPA: type II secretion system protein [Gemmatimonadales bacterium]|jgi:prepilin-type N-terminal cleavage/methylation domain-containing protein